MSEVGIEGVYRHNKTGKLYQVNGVALHTETAEKMVIYKGLYRSPDLEVEYGNDPSFVRPYDMFFENIEINGESVARFEKVNEEAKSV